MVNYTRMEPVWRSYGPLEPIGPSASKPKRRGRRVALAGVAVVCAGGAALGAYLKPDLDAETPRLGASEAAAEPTRIARRATPEEPLRLEVMLEELAALPLPGEMGAAGGALPADTIPPSSAPLGAGPSIAAAGSAIAAPAAAPVPVRLGAPAARPAAAAPARAGYAPPVHASAAPEPVVRQQAVAPSVAPPRHLVLASREEPRITPAVAPVMRESPSFSCGGSLSAAQEMVCERPALTALDRQMAVEFAAVIASGQDRARLQLDQDAWLARREAAAPDPAAVADAYKRRIRQLRAMR